MDHRFRPGGKIGQTFDLLSDLEWHCAAHEFPGSQAQAQIKSLRRRGFAIKTEKMYCPHCGSEETHDQLLALEPQSEAIIRVPRQKPAKMSGVEYTRLRMGARSIRRGLMARDWRHVESGLQIVDDYLAHALNDLGGQRG